MSLRSHGNGIAIALSGLAVVLAGTGTAVAVSTAKVSLVDASNPSHAVKVDSHGALSIAQTPTTINVVDTLYSHDYFIPEAKTAPTLATLGVTEAVYDSSLNSQFENTDTTVQLVKIQVGSSGTCSDADRTVTALRSDSVHAGDSLGVAFPFPLQVAPKSGHAYCLGMQARWSDVPDGPTGESAALYVTIGAYVISGTYSG